jgi:hypothetical protein
MEVIENFSDQANQTIQVRQKRPVMKNTYVLLLILQPMKTVKHYSTCISSSRNTS